MFPDSKTTPTKETRMARIAPLLTLSLIILAVGGAGAQAPPELNPDLPDYDPGFPSSHLLESWDLGDLGYSWKEDLGVEGNERIFFKWFHELPNVVQGDWVVRESGGSVIASGTVVPTDPPPSETLWSIDLGTLGSPTYPLRVQIEAVDGSGSAVAGGQSNEVYLNEYVPGPNTCFTDFGVGLPFTARLEAIRNKWQVPALAAGVVTAGSGSQYDAVGWRKLVNPLVPVTPTDKWHIGSNTKAMTAMLVGLLQQKPAPLVQFNTTIADVFPQSWFGTLPAHQSTTIEMLLAHRSGIPNDETVPPQAWAALTDINSTLIEKRRNYALELLTQQPAHPPDTVFDYANAGYIIVAAMLEELYGQSWETLMTQELLGVGKLGMTDTGHGAPPPLNNSDQPWGHDAITGNVLLMPSKGDNPVGAGPAGRIHTTLQDYGKFLRLLLNGTEGGVTLNPATLAELTSPWPGTNYGYGWGIKEVADGADTKTILGHAGSNGAWFFASEVRLDDGYALVAVTNVNQFWKPDLNPFNGITVNEEGFFPHGPAAVNETLRMLHEHFAGCPSWGIAGGGWITETGGIKEGRSLALLPTILQEISVLLPVVSFWGGLLLMAAIGAYGLRSLFNA